MKRLIALVAALFLLCGCQGKVDLEPVWSRDLSGGASVSVSNCAVTEETALYRGEGETEARELPLIRAEGLPVLSVSGAEHENVTIDYCMEQETGGYGPAEKYDVVTHTKEGVDYIVTAEDGVTHYRIDTIYNFYICVTTEEGSDEFLLVCHRNID